VNERLSSILDISMRSVGRLKREIREIDNEIIEMRRKVDEEKQEKEI
jgi:hypothetical protein